MDSSRGRASGTITEANDYHPPSLNDWWSPPFSNLSMTVGPPPFVRPFFHLWHDGGFPGGITTIAKNILA